LSYAREACPSYPIPSFAQINLSPKILLLVVPVTATENQGIPEHLSRLGGGERNSFRPDGTKVAQQPSERALAPFHVAAFSLARHLSHITRHFRMRYSGTRTFVSFC